MKKYDFDEAVFTYAISDKKIEKFSHQLVLHGKELVINYTSSTVVLHKAEENREIAIIGLCVDSYGKIEREKIPYFFLKQNFASEEDAYTFCDRFSGKYVFIYIIGDKCYAWGDATCSMPLNYAGSLKNKRFCISPFDKMTADYLGLQIDPDMEKIRRGQDPAQAMPGDLTPYREVRALLPNQLLNMTTGKAVRTKIKEYAKNKNSKRYIEHSYKLAVNIAAEYRKHYEMICPFTSGYDSRIVFGILKKICPEILCFTQKYVGFDSRTPDIYIPDAICRNYGQKYRILDYKETPLQYIQDVFADAGWYNSPETVKEAYMYGLEFKEEARINGNIAGQIGKSSITNTVPDFLGSASFFQCKIHNTEKASRKAMKEYLSYMKKSGRNICDIFALENRCGRWAGQEEALYSLCGMNSLNIFNCRQLIRDWMSVSRRFRVNKELHKEFILLSDEKLLQFPFNPDEKYSFMKRNWVLFYIATFVKQGLLLFGIHCD